MIDPGSGFVHAVPIEKDDGIVLMSERWWLHAGKIIFFALIIYCISKSQQQTSIDFWETFSIILSVKLCLSELDQVTVDLELLS